VLRGGEVIEGLQHKLACLNELRAISVPVACLPSMNVRIQQLHVFIMRVEGVNKVGFQGRPYGFIYITWTVF